MSHANLIANVEQTIVMRYAHKPYPPHKRPAERWIGFLPLYHAYGQCYTILMAARLATPVYVMAEFRYEEFLFNIGRYKITSLQIAPPILVMLSKRVETSRYDLRSLRDCLCGAAPLSKELQNECQRRFGMQINQGWGMTEVTCGAIHVPGGVSDDSGSVGQLDPNCELKLLDDEGKEVEEGQPGEIFVRGPQVCLGYWRNEEATRESIDADGWLKTGDIAVCNKEGYFWIVDRKKVCCLFMSMLLTRYGTLTHRRNSSKSTPCKSPQRNSKACFLRTSTLPMLRQSVSQCTSLLLLPHLLHSHFHIQTSLSDISSPSPQNRKDVEAPRAYIVIHESSRGKVTPRDIQEWIKARVAKHKYLNGGVVFVEEVPKLASGKIQRKVMREWAKRDAAEIERRVESSERGRAKL